MLLTCTAVVLTRTIVLSAALNYLFISIFCRVPADRTVVLLECFWQVFVQLAVYVRRVRSPSTIVKEHLEVTEESHFITYSS